MSQNRCITLFQEYSFRIRYTIAQAGMNLNLKQRRGSSAPVVSLIADSPFGRCHADSRSRNDAVCVRLCTALQIPQGASSAHLSRK